jgi:hypothetical protein
VKPIKYPSVLLVQVPIPKKNYPYLPVQEMLSTLLPIVVAAAIHPAVFAEDNRLLACVSGRKEMRK